MDPLGETAEGTEYYRDLIMALLDKLQRFRDTICLLLRLRRCHLRDFCNVRAWVGGLLLHSEGTLSKTSGPTKTTVPQGTYGVFGPGGVH